MPITNSQVRFLMSKYLLIFLILGITSTIFPQENYYWHGGQGNWSDVNNWRLENGLMPEQIPGEFDDVIFYEESFLFPYDTVYIDINNASCNNMRWLNIASPVVLTASSSTILYIYGSLTLHSNFINDFWGEIHFSSIPGDNNSINKEDSDTIRSAGNAFLNHIRLIGNDDYIVLADDLEFYYNEYTYPEVSSNLYLVHGGLDLNGNTLTCGSFWSIENNERIINIENSDVILQNRDQNVWKVNGENLELNAFGSTINLTNFLAVMLTENGGNGNVLQYHDVIMDTILCMIDNTNGIVAYNRVFANSQMCEIRGNFIAEWIDLYGTNSAIIGTSTINVVSLNNTNCEITGEHTINKCFVNEGTGRISGSNHIKYCKFIAKGEFRGENVFDTLMLFSGSGSGSSSGIIYTFESGKTQTITDSLFLRGDPCANITIKSSIPNTEALIKKDNGYDLICDFLIIQDVAVESENIQFYAGGYSSTIPDPSNPPSGWIMDNSPGYTFGFGNGQMQTIEGCFGEPVLLNAINFNGNPFTQYFWNEDTIPGNSTLEVFNPGTYSVKAYYIPTCYFEDSIFVIYDSCENDINEKDFRELFHTYPNPTNGYVTIESSMISENSFISVFDLNGIIRYQEMIKPTGLDFFERINLRHLQPGIYYVQIKNRKINAMQKLVVY